MAAVEGTNLRLVVVNRICSCEENENTKLTTKPEDSILFILLPFKLTKEVSRCQFLLHVAMIIFIRIRAFDC